MIELTAIVCPWCNAEFDCAAVFDGKPDATPKNGDISLCESCGEWKVFDSFLTGRMPSHGPTNS